jgi:hypothetical protein
MFTRLCGDVITDGGATVTDLKIFLIVCAALVIFAAIRLLPDLVRYLKIRAM